MIARRRLCRREVVVLVGNPKRARAEALAAFFTLAAVLVACKQGGGAGSKCSSDGECNNGFLCESDVCLDAVKVKALREAAQPKALPPNPVAQPSPEVLVPVSPPPGTVPPGSPAPGSPSAPATQTVSRFAAGYEGIGEHSTPPTTGEWDAVQREITVAHSTPLHCETKMLREWLRVSCRGKEIQNLTVRQREGVTAGEVMTFARAGQTASLVMPIRGSLSVSVSYTWSWGSRTLSVHYGAGERAPDINFNAPPP